LECAQQPKIAEINKKNLILEVQGLFKVIDVDTTEKLVTGACCDRGKRPRLTGPEGETSVSHRSWLSVGNSLPSQRCRPSMLLEVPVVGYFIGSQKLPCLWSCYFHGLAIHILVIMSIDSVGTGAATDRTCVLSESAGDDNVNAKRS